ncbi:helix-turn-helix domain-containing protein [Chloroflexota bacterium]
MRIGRADFETGNIGSVHQAVLDVIPEEEAIEEAELRSAYDKAPDPNKPSFEQVVENLSHRINRRQIDGRTFYILKKEWLSSAEVARRLGVSMRTVQAWGQRGVMGARYVGDRLRFAGEVVEEWVRGKRVTTVGKTKDTVLTEVWDNEKDAEYDRL